MKKKLIIIFVSVLIAVAVIGGGTFAYASNVAKKNSIGLDKALNIAMLDAGVTEKNTTVTQAKMDFEKGIFIYEIEFVSDSNVEYEYKIKAADGTILERDEELDDDLTAGENQYTEKKEAANNTAIPADEASTDVTNKDNTAAVTHKEATTAAANSGTSADISLDEAKTIALRNANVSSTDAKFTSAHKDYDDGISYYEIEFRTSDYEYEYEISMNGKIISYDKDRISAKPVTTQSNKVSTKFIGVDKAKTIALENEGLSADEVRFKKAKLDHDDGIDLYEIEFVCNGVEYEYEINARTEEIHSHSSELDD